MIFLLIDGSLQFQDLLTDLKAQAEALVLFANDIDGLLTCALRPSNVFGPGDTEIVPFLVNFAKSGWAKVENYFCASFSCVIFTCMLYGIDVETSLSECLAE